MAAMTSGENKQYYKRGLLFFLLGFWPLGLWAKTLGGNKMINAVNS